MVQWEDAETTIMSHGLKITGGYPDRAARIRALAERMVIRSTDILYQERSTQAGRVDQRWQLAALVTDLFDHLEAAEREKGRNRE